MIGEKIYAKNPDTLQATLALAQLLTEFVGRTGSGSYPDPRHIWTTPQVLRLSHEHIYTYLLEIGLLAPEIFDF